MLTDPVPRPAAAPFSSSFAARFPPAIRLVAACPPPAQLTGVPPSAISTAQVIENVHSCEIGEWNTEWPELADQYTAAGLAELFQKTAENKCHKIYDFTPGETQTEHRRTGALLFTDGGC